jgi:hypothetical protein
MSVGKTWKKLKKDQKRPSARYMYGAPESFERVLGLYKTFPFSQR